MKHKKAISALVFSLLIILPIAASIGTVSAQAGYTIDNVDHQVEVMYSGHIVIRDTIQVSGQLSDGFLIGLPFKYSAYILKALAFDETNVYPISLGVPLGDRGAFYAARIDFDNQSPNVFTVVFVLSNRLITEPDLGIFTLDFPAYPSFVKEAANCDASIALPTPPIGITITKDDGEVNGASYARANLPAYTYSPATASFQLPTGALQVIQISELNRQVTINPAGQVTSSDSYRITNNSTSSMRAFPMGLPAGASNIVVRDEFGRFLETVVGSVSGNTLQTNVTLISVLNTGQATTITAEYNLPSATEKDGSFVLGNFKFFPDFNYFVESASLTLIPPEGATILAPRLSELDPSSSLTRQLFQDTLTVRKSGISYVDYSVPIDDDLQLTYNYNPLWVSLRPTFWASLLAVVGCVAVVIFRKRKGGEEELEEVEPQRVLTTSKPSASLILEQQKKMEVKTGVRVTVDTIRDFIDVYEDYKRLNNDLKALEISARKGRMPRRQYKVQRKALETRLVSVSREIEELKAVFRGTGGSYGNFVNQIDSAESDLVGAEEEMKNLEVRQNRGEIAIDVYKKKLADLERRQEKAEATINGILLRLREKIY